MRIKVDFSEFFDDERKLSVVNVDPKESTAVRDVLEKIIRLFRLTTSRRRSKRGDPADEKPEYGLFEEGFYIPPEETSTVLQEIGILKLKSLSDPKVDTSESPEKKKKHKKRKSEDDFADEPKKTRKSRVDDEDSTRCENRKGENVEKRRGRRVKVEDVECSKRQKGHWREEPEESDEDSEESYAKIASSKKTKSPVQQKLRDSCQSSDVEVVKVEEVKKERRKRQQSVEPSESESEVHSEEGDVSKPTKRRSLRKGRNNAQKSAAPIQKESQQSGESCETVAATSSKRHKKESYTDNMSVTSTNEIQSSSPKTRRHKKDNVTESEAFGTSDKCSVGNTRRNKRLSKSLIEDEMQVEDTEIALKEDKNVSQEEEVSTSCFIYLESEETVDNSNDSENFCAESRDSSPVLSCVDEHYKPGPKSRRRRKHAKRRKKSVPSEAKEEASVSHAAPHLSACNSSATNVNYRNNVSSSSMNKHVIFGSDDEEEVTSYNNSCDGNDIEIVGQVTRPSGISSQNPLGFQNQGVIDVEGEDVFRGLVDTSDLGITADGIRSMYCQSTAPSLEALNHLRRMSEQKTLTVVQVTSKTESVTTQTFRLPDMLAQTDCHGPPSPVHQSFEVGENTKKTFRNLLSLQDRMDPLVLKPSGEMNMLSDEEEEEAEVDLQSKVLDATESSCPSSLPKTFPQKSSCGESDGFDNSGLSDIDKEGSPVDDRPGPSTRSSKKSAPRPYHALGRLLTNLRNTGSSRGREEKLTPMSCLEEAFRDSDITSTLTDPESSRPVSQSKLDEEGDDSKTEDRSKSDAKSALCDKTDEADIMRDLTEELKGDLLKEVEDTTSNKDATISKYPLMNCLPRVGEFLAIKTLTLDANLCPVHSDYMKVQVVEVSGLVVKMKTLQNTKKMESVSKVTDEDGVEEVDLTFDEEVDLTEEDPAQILELDWRDIVEPRLLFP
ncbi:uncharacterized protein [Macrobrachium rosenbergii]|uniref:uncharacterized protein isoform X2 n=1 Tax=Macrobrachium rosenbergii TaxID=79674 RepID=UPI0034D5FB30